VSPQGATPYADIWPAGEYPAPAPDGCQGRGFADRGAAWTSRVLRRGPPSGVSATTKPSGCGSGPKAWLPLPTRQAPTAIAPSLA